MRSHCFCLAAKNLYRQFFFRVLRTCDRIAFALLHKPIETKLSDAFLVMMVYDHIALALLQTLVDAIMSDAFLEVCGHAIALRSLCGKS